MITLISLEDQIFFSLILACVILNELWFLEILEMNCTYMYLDDFRQFYLRKN